MSDLEWIVEWYARHCDGEWEDSYGVTIETLDNPGWALVINLEQTDLEGRAFSKVVVERSEKNWIRCYVEESNFKGFGGAKNLADLLRIFRSWAESRSCPEV